MKNVLLIVMYRALMMLITRENFLRLADLCRQMDPIKALTNTEKCGLVVDAAKGLGLSFSANLFNVMVALILEWSRTRAIA